MSDALIQAMERVQSLESENNRLKDAIRRLAEQDATLSVHGGNVTVTMDGTLADEEREAVEVAAQAYADDHGERFAATLRSLLDRLK
jgi:DNA-binding protein YbaB